MDFIQAFINEDTGYAQTRLFDYFGGFLCALHRTGINGHKRFIFQKTSRRFCLFPSSGTQMKIRHTAIENNIRIVNFAMSDTVKRQRCGHENEFSSVKKLKYSLYAKPKVLPVLAFLL
jgi:hypothetical protein